VKVAVYPGSFDPLTNGHLDIVERAVKIFDKLWVVVFSNPGKNPLFSIEERVEIIKEATSHLPNVEVEHSYGLLSTYMEKKGSVIVLRALRAVSDFDYEFQLHLMNKKLNPLIETMFMMTASEYSFLSSSIVKEVAAFGGCIEGLVPRNVAVRLKEKLKQNR